MAKEAKNEQRRFAWVCVFVHVLGIVVVVVVANYINPEGHSHTTCCVVCIYLMNSPQSLCVVLSLLNDFMLLPLS